MHRPRRSAGRLATSTGLCAATRLGGRPVDFSHGDVDAFTLTPGAFERFCEAVEAGGRQAYTEYRGSEDIRGELAQRLAAFTGAPGVASSPGNASVEISLIAVVKAHQGDGQT